LKKIKKDDSASSRLWKAAEQKAIEYLTNRDYSDIINLNEISPQSHFDLLCRKDSEWWLIDTTINENKDLAKKTIRVVKNFRCAILYVSHDLNDFILVELKPI